ncbi:hypothetical protein V8C44DRAFT_141210 [Trichoderma aethiopicum]
MQRSTIGVGRAKAVGGKRGPRLSLDAFTVGCQFPPPLQRPIRLRSPRKLDQSSKNPQRSRRTDRTARVRVCARRRRRNEARKPRSRGNESNFASARRRCFPGRQGIPRPPLSPVEDQYDLSSIPCLLSMYFLGEKKRQYRRPCLSLSPLQSVAECGRLSRRCKCKCRLHVLCNSAGP